MTATTPATAKQIAISLTSDTGFTDIAKVIKDGTQLSVLENTVGALKLEAILVMIISDYNASLNVVRPLNNNQIVDIAMELSKEYWHYTIEDFICFFHLAKRGAVSSQRDNIIRDRIDIQMVYAMLSEYDTVRLQKIKDLQESWKNSSPDRPGATIDVKAADLIRWMDNPPTRAELEEKLGRKLTEQECKKYDIKDNE